MRGAAFNGAAPSMGRLWEKKRKKDRRKGGPFCGIGLLGGLGGFTAGAEALRLEMNDPANGQLIDPDCFEYALDNTRFRLNIVRNNRKVLRYLEEHHINTELYGEIVLHYTPLSKPQLETLSAVTLRLFFGELLF